MTVVCVHQPDFAPWLGFFDRLLASDIYVVFDNVQYVRRGWHHRDKIKTANGTAWLTLPIVKKGKYEQLIRDTEIDMSQAWQRKHLGTLRGAYGKAPHFETVHADIERIYTESGPRLMDLNMALIRHFLDVLRIDVEIVFASDLGVGGTKNDLLVSIVEACGGSTYLTGTGSRSYLDEDLFAAHGIDVAWQTFSHPRHAQLHGDFAEGLSALDGLFNCSDQLADILRAARSDAPS